MDPEGIMLSEVSQTEKDKYHMVSLMCVVESKRQNKQTKQNSQLQRTEWWLPEGKGVCQWTKWVKGNKRNNLPVIK